MIVVDNLEGPLPDPGRWGRIHSNLVSMCSLFDRAAHMAFTLGLVELRHYTSVPPGRELWVPGVAGSVVPVPRTYFQPGESLNPAASSDDGDSVLESGAPGDKRRRSKLSEIEARDAFMSAFQRSQAEPAPHTILSLIGHAEAHGLFPEFTATGSSLIIRCFDEVTEYPYNLLTINSDGRLGATDFLQWQLESQKLDSGIAVKHYGRIADLFGGAKWTPAPTSKNPDRHQIRDHAGKPPFFSTGLDSDIDPTDFLERLFEIFEETAQSIREDSGRLVGE